MLLHRHRIIGAAFDGGVIGDDHAFAAGYPPHPGNDAGGMDLAAVEAVGRKWRQFEARRRRRPDRASRGVRRPMRAWPRHCVQNRTRWGRSWNEAAWPSAVYGAPQSGHWGSHHGVIAPPP